MEGGDRGVGAVPLGLGREGEDEQAADQAAEGGDDSGTSQGRPKGRIAASPPSPSGSGGVDAGEGAEDVRR